MKKYAIGKPDELYHSSWSFQLDTKFKFTEGLCVLLQTINGVAECTAMASEYYPRYHALFRIAKMFDVEEVKKEVEKVMDEYLSNPIYIDSINTEMSLEDQLRKAILEENYELATILQEKIKIKNSESK